MTNEDDPLRIIHLDKDLLVVAKPGGMSVHRGEWSDRDETFVLQKASEQTGRFLYPVHRLDRATSGVLSFALSREAARNLQASLQSDETVKEYITLVRGETPQRFTSDRPLKNDHGEPRPAFSDFERLAFFSRSSLLRVRIRTGRRHQIRRHLNHLAHQVIGDSSYGKGRINAFFRETYGLPRMFLHARRLVVAHPTTGLTLELLDPLPDDLRDFLLRLPDVTAATLVDV